MKELKETDILIIDYFNILKRYICLEDNQDPGTFLDIYVTKVLGRIFDLILQTNPSLVFIASDSGSNKRAIAINSEYKANRKRAKTDKDKKIVENKVELSKRFIQTLPIIFIEHQNTEADFVIYCLLKYLKNRIEDVNYLVATSDSDLLQLLDDNTFIHSWTKPKYIITQDNFDQHYGGLEGFNFIQSYCLAKSITGDSSDNIKGLSGYGWGRTKKLFNIIGHYNDHMPTNYSELIECVDNINVIDKKELKFKNDFRSMIINNEQLLRNNQKIIDFSELENPYVMQIFRNIKDSINNGISLNSRNLQKLMNVTGYEDGSDHRDAMYIRSKFNKNVFYLKGMEKKGNQFIKEFLK